MYNVYEEKKTYAEEVIEVQVKVYYYNERRAFYYGVVDWADVGGAVTGLAGTAAAGAKLAKGTAATAAGKGGLLTAWAYGWFSLTTSVGRKIGLLPDVWDYQYSTWEEHSRKKLPTEIRYSNRVEYGPIYQCPEKLAPPSQPQHHDNDDNDTSSGSSGTGPGKKWGWGGHHHDTTSGSSGEK